LDCNRLRHIDCSATSPVEECQHSQISCQASWCFSSIWCGHHVSSIWDWANAAYNHRTCCIAIKRYVTTLNIDLDDLTFSLVKPCLWNMIESSVTICCAALPGSTSALRKMLPMDILERAVKWIERRLTKTSPSHSRDEHSHDPEMAHADPNIRTQTDGRAPYSPSTS